MLNNEKRADAKILKAGVAYTLGGVITKGMVFITVPLFTRLLTIAEYGYYSNYATWLSLISLVVTCSLYSSMGSARFDYYDSLEDYSFTIIVLGNIFTIIGTMIFICFSSFFESLFSLDTQYILLIMLYSMVVPAFSIFQQLQRYRYKYILITVITLGINIIATLISLVAVLVGEDKLKARICGYQFPIIACYYLIYFYLILKSNKRFSWKQSRYALKICIPLVFHLLGGMLLNSADKVMINYFSGPEETALYSVAYMVAMMEYILIVAMNDSFSPWLGEMLHVNNPTIVRDFSRKYVFIFALILNIIFFIAPEVLYFLGGEQYIEAIWIIPPIVLGYFFYFLYTMYVDIEQLLKKTIGVAVSTVLAAIGNIILNALFIPIYGYAASAYTTLLSYIFLLLFHYFAVKKMQKAQFYDSKNICLVVGIELVIMCVALWSYQYMTVRYTILVVYMAGIALLMKKNKILLLNLIKGERLVNEKNK